MPNKSASLQLSTILPSSIRVVSIPVSLSEELLEEAALGMVSSASCMGIWPTKAKLSRRSSPRWESCFRPSRRRGDPAESLGSARDTCEDPGGRGYEDRGQGLWLHLRFSGQQYVWTTSRRSHQGAVGANLTIDIYRSSAS